MKKSLFILLFCLFFISCVDYAARLFQLEVIVQNVDDIEGIYAKLNYTTSDIIYDESGVGCAYDSREIFLGKKNNYSSGYVYNAMGIKPRDLKTPKGALKTFLDEISSSGIFVIYEKTDQNNLVKKYTISYSKEDVEDLTQEDDLYRRYKITLDWNKKVQISE